MISQCCACSLSTFETNDQFPQNLIVRKNLNFRSHLSLVNGNFLQPISTTWQKHELKKMGTPLALLNLLSSDDTKQQIFYTYKGLVYYSNMALQRNLFFSRLDSSN